MGSSLGEFYVRFADQMLKLHVQYLETKNYVREYMVKDIKEEQEALDVYVTSEDVVREWKFFLSRDGYDKAFVNRLPGYYFEIFALHRKVCEALLSRNILAVHGSCVAVDQRAYIFMASSGTGKSTHAKLWCDTFGDRAVLLNDDKPWLRLMPDGKIRVYGSPWTGKHHRGVNGEASLRAVCALYRSDRAKVEEESGQMGRELLMKQTIHPGKKSQEVEFQKLLEKICTHTSFYSIGSDRNRESVRYIYERIKGS